MGAVPIGICFPFPHRSILPFPPKAICLPDILLISYNAHWYGEKAVEPALGGWWLLLHIEEVLKLIHLAQNYILRAGIPFISTKCLSQRVGLLWKSYTRQPLIYENVNKTAISAQPVRELFQKCLTLYSLMMTKRRVHRNRAFLSPSSKRPCLACYLGVC